MLTLQYTSGGNAIHLRHADVHHNNGRLVRRDLGHGLRTIACLINHIDIRVRLQKRSQTLTKHQMVIHDQHSDALGGRHDDPLTGTNDEAIRSGFGK
jgi:hypothetical protein